MTVLNLRTARIRVLNDRLRTDHVGGRIVLTCGIAALPPSQVRAIVAAVRTFDGFNDDNDPHGEHDFGSLTIAGTPILFNIDYYDPTCTSHSTDPGNERMTARVMTVMLSEEY